MDFYLPVYELIRDCYKLKDLDLENEETEVHAIPHRKNLDYCKKNHRPFTPVCVENAQMATLPSHIYVHKVGALNEKRCKKTRKSVSWSSGERIGITFSNDEYDRKIDKFQIKKNIFLCIVLNRIDY